MRLAGCLLGLVLLAACSDDDSPATAAPPVAKSGVEKPSLPKPPKSGLPAELRPPR